MTIFNKQEKKVAEDLQSLSQQLIWITIFISRGIMYNIMTRPLNCIIHSDKIFEDYCHPKLNIAEAIIWIIIEIMRLVFSFFRAANGIFNGWLLVVQNILTVIQTILVEECRLASALLNVGGHGIYGEYVIFKSTFKRIGGNQLEGVCVWVVGSSGIASLILTPLNALSSMNSIGLKVLAIIIFYVSIIVIITITAFTGYTLVGRIDVNL
ncbi:MAG: hypothetical protein EZS28_035284 [Streblomastix strix]|uniref:Uncharacterized protein n=1 Tax=Streblomastix strix TaxID=222440 RepID=A0A5J4UEX5_9EUKA|nr:MAG: hypothetical protein EZS28_035284 [Streblomastix strix]